MDNIKEVKIPTEESDILNSYRMKSYELPSNFYEVDTFTINITCISDARARYIIETQHRQPFHYPAQILSILQHNKRVKLITIESFADEGNTKPHEYKALKMHDTYCQGDNGKIYMPVGSFVFRGVIYSLHELCPAPPPPKQKSNIIPATTIPGISQRGN